MFTYQLVIQDPPLSAAELQAFLGHEFSLDDLRVEFTDGPPPQLSASFRHPWLEPETVISMIETRFPIPNAEITRRGAIGVTGHESQQHRALDARRRQDAASPVPVSKDLLGAVRGHFQEEAPVSRARLLGLFGVQRAAEVDAALAELRERNEIRRMPGRDRYIAASAPATRGVDAKVVRTSPDPAPEPPAAPDASATQAASSEAAGQWRRPPTEERILALLREGVVASRAGLDAAALPVQGLRVSRAIARLLEDGLIRETEGRLYLRADQPDPEPRDAAAARLGGTNAPAILTTLAEPHTLDELSPVLGLPRTVLRSRLAALEDDGQIRSGRVGHNLKFCFDAEALERAQAEHARGQEERVRDRARASAEAPFQAIREGRMPDEARPQERRILALLPFEGEVLPSRLRAELQGTTKEVDRDLVRLVRWMLVEWVKQGRLRLLRLTEAGRTVARAQDPAEDRSEDPAAPDTARLPAYQSGDPSQDADHIKGRPDDAAVEIPPDLALFLEAERTDAEVAGLLGVGEREVTSRMAPLLRAGLLHEREIGGERIWGIRDSILEDHERAQAAQRLASRLRDLMDLVPLLSLDRIDAVAQGTSRSGIQAALRDLIEARQIRHLDSGLYIRADLPDPTPEVLAALVLAGPAQAPDRTETAVPERHRNATPPEPRPAPRLMPRPNTPGSAILAYLAEHPTLNTTSAYALAPQSTPTAVNQALSTLVKQGHLRRIGRGTYEASHQEVEKVQAVREARSPTPMSATGEIRDPEPRETALEKPEPEEAGPEDLYAIAVEPEPDPEPEPELAPVPGQELLLVLSTGDFTSKEIEERLAGQSDAAQGMRARLNDLRRDGLVERSVLSNPGQAPRVEWSITAEGRALLPRVRPVAPQPVARPKADPVEAPPPESPPTASEAPSDPAAGPSSEPADLFRGSAPPPPRPKRTREPGPSPAERQAADRKAVLENLTLFRSASPADLRKRLPALAKPGGKVTSLLAHLEHEGVVHRTGGADPEAGRFSLSEAGWTELGLSPP